MNLDAGMLRGQNRLDVMAAWVYPRNPLENSVMSSIVWTVKKEKCHVIPWLDAEKAFGKALNLWKKIQKRLEN